MVNYNNGKIYKIINEKGETIYIGSTTETLCRRFGKHKLFCKNNKIILIENHSCNNREELRKREQEIINETPNLLNINKAYRSPEDLKQQEREKSKRLYKNSPEYRKRQIEISKKWRIDNPEKVLENKKKYNSKRINCDICGCEVYLRNLKRHQDSLKCKKFIFQDLEEQLESSQSHTTPPI